MPELFHLRMNLRENTINACMHSFVLKHIWNALCNSDPMLDTDMKNTWLSMASPQRECSEMDDS